MIELVILAVAIALGLVLLVVALVLTGEIRKQERPSRFKTSRQSSQLTPEQQKAIQPLAYLGGSIGMIASAFGRAAGLSLLEFCLIGLALGLFIGVLTWLVLRSSSNRPTISSAAPPQKLLPPASQQRQLIRMCGGDRQTAERLAALEGGDWQAAIDRLIRDRR